jgi:ribosome-associated protein
MSTPVSIKTETIDLDQFLKLADVVASGGEAKWMIREGIVTVNGEAETRRRRTLHLGDVVQIPDAGEFEVVAKTST